VTRAPAISRLQQSKTDCAPEHLWRWAQFIAHCSQESTASSTLGRRASVYLQLCHISASCPPVYPYNITMFGEVCKTYFLEVKIYILWYIHPLLDNDRETNNETMVVARQRPIEQQQRVFSSRSGRQQSKAIIEELFETVCVWISDSAILTYSYDL
jgi:hypothetical protein